MGGQIPMITPAMGGQVVEFHRMRILVAVSPRRLPGTPELPTAVEQGFPKRAVVEKVRVYRIVERPAETTPGARGSK
jgi:tripartite-type tricarboxylate transporter receptor subunit TctC